MGVTNDSFADGSLPKFAADHANGINLEIKNYIEDSGQSHSVVDREQLSKGASRFAAYGDFYTEAGAADAYVLTPVGNQKGVSSLADGMKFRFKPSNTNTGASTVNINGLGLKDIRDISGNALVAGAIVMDEHVDIEYDSSSDYFVLIGTDSSKEPSIILQDYTTIGDIGDALQQWAGHMPSLAEIDSMMSNGTTIAYYLFANGLLTTDETGTYTLVNNNAAINANGIMGTAYGTELNGINQYYSQGTLLDVLASLVNGLFVSMYVKIDDGQPAAAMYLFDKITVAGQDSIDLYIDTDGNIHFLTEENNNGGKDLIARTILPNGALGWYHIAFGMDATYGKRLWVQRVLENIDPDETTLPNDGTASDCIIGAHSTPSNYHDGRFAQVLIRDMVATQRDVDLLFSTRYAIPAAFQGKDFFANSRVTNAAGQIYNKKFQEVARDTSYLYRQGFSGLETDDTLRIILNRG